MGCASWGICEFGDVSIRGCVSLGIRSKNLPLEFNIEFILLGKNTFRIEFISLNISKTE